MEIQERNISMQFLFDKHKSGRQNYSIGKEVPKVRWEFSTRGYPYRGPESTAVFDGYGNIYFGSHDGCIYSITKDGKLRWMFKTDKKIYSSPTLYKDYVVFAGGDGYLYCFNLEGDVNWVYDISKGYRGLNLKNIINRLITIHKTYDYNRKKVWDIKCWASPYVDNDTVYIVGYGIGLNAVDIQTGSRKWTYDLGSPRFHLTGIVEDNNDRLYVCSQRRNLHCISKDGHLLWKKALKKDYDIWGNPTFDLEKELIYLSQSNKERDSIIYAIDTNGNISWSKKLKTAVRGSISISSENYVVVLGFDGVVYFLNKDTGEIQYKERFSSASRALWTTASIDSNGNILFTTKESNTEGALIALDKNGGLLWKYKQLGKALSTPVVDDKGNIYVGSWKGKYLCLRTK